MTNAPARVQSDVPGSFALLAHLKMRKGDTSTPRTTFPSILPLGPMSDSPFAPPPIEIIRSKRPSFKVAMGFFCASVIAVPLNLIVIIFTIKDAITPLFITLALLELVTGITAAVQFFRFGIHPETTSRFGGITLALAAAFIGLAGPAALGLTQGLIEVSHAMEGFSH